MTRSRTQRATLAPEFVSFHADREAQGGGAHPHPGANLRSDRYMRMLDLLYRSARLFHRDAACTLLTSAATRVQKIRGAVRRVDLPIDLDALMLSRAQAQASHVADSDFARPLVLVDSDILFRSTLQPMFGEDFDVALTWRSSSDMPINGGLIILNNRRPEVSKHFFAEFVERYRQVHAGEGNAAWYGDQLALRDCVGLSHREMSEQRIRNVNGCRIRFLPCETHNFSPDNRFSAIVSGLPDKLVLHFKGQRKRLMQPFWDAFLQPAESRMPWARWTGGRAMRRLHRSLEQEAASSA